MPRKNRKWVLVLVALVGLVGLAGGLYAHWGMTGSSYRYGPGSLAPERYRLTEEQWRKIDDIHARYNEKILPLERKLSSKRLELKAYASGPEPTPEKIKAYYKEIRDLEGKIEDLKVDAHAEIAKVLTREQRDYFGDIYTFWDIGDGWNDYCPMMRGHRGWWGHGSMGMHQMGGHFGGAPHGGMGHHGW